MWLACNYITTTKESKDGSKAVTGKPYFHLAVSSSAIGDFTELHITLHIHIDLSTTFCKYSQFSSCI